MGTGGSDRGDGAGPVGHGSLGGRGVRGESLPAVRDSGVHVQFDRDPGAVKLCNRISGGKRGKDEFKLVAQRLGILRAGLS